MNLIFLFFERKKNTAKNKQIESDKRTKIKKRKEKKKNLNRKEKIVSL